MFVLLLCKYIYYNNALLCIHYGHEGGKRIGKNRIGLAEFESAILGLLARCYTDRQNTTVNFMNNRILYVSPLT